MNRCSYSLKFQYIREILDFRVLGLWVLEFWECWGFGDEKDPFLINLKLAVKNYFSLILKLICFRLELLIV